MTEAGVWEVYVEIGCNMLQLIGCIFCDADGGAFKIGYLFDGYPDTNLIYCEYLSKDEWAILGDSAYGQCDV